MSERERLLDWLGLVLEACCYAALIVRGGSPLEMRIWLQLYAMCLRSADWAREDTCRAGWRAPVREAVVAA